jgi:hypothetical protein
VVVCEQRNEDEGAVEASLKITMIVLPVALSPLVPRYSIILSYKEYIKQTSSSPETKNTTRRGEEQHGILGPRSSLLVLLHILHLVLQL